MRAPFWFLAPDPVIPLTFRAVDILMVFMNVTKYIAVTSPTRPVYGLMYASYVHGPDLQFPHSYHVSITITVSKPENHRTD